MEMRLVTNRIFKMNINNNAYTIGFVGEYNFLKRLRFVITKNNHSLSDGSFYKEGSVWRLKWNGKKLWNTIQDWMMRDASVFLDRKH